MFTSSAAVFCFVSSAPPPPPSSFPGLAARPADGAGPLPAEPAARTTLTRGQPAQGTTCTVLLCLWSAPGRLGPAPAGSARLGSWFRAVRAGRISERMKHIFLANLLNGRRLHKLPSVVFLAKLAQQPDRHLPPFVLRPWLAHRKDQGRSSA